MQVEIAPHVRDTAGPFGAGVPYALKVVAGQLAEDPDMGRPSGLPGILTVTVGGDLFEDCPALTIGYAREPDRIEVRYVNLTAVGKPAEAAEHREDRNPDRSADPAALVITVREVTNAWKRITTCLQRTAPDSNAALRGGATSAAIAALEQSLRTQIPGDLHALWCLTAGDDTGSTARVACPAIKP
ncbi:hypothetical protein [Streptomyces lavendulocolor]|uniref:hypothetical protein n=1 Tax=Streptomyces lavendulocolor TaxID=67316 RepID=UPI003C2E284C